MTSLCDFLFISPLLSSLLRFVFIKFSTYTHIYTHITHTHTHTAHTNAIELNMLARLSRYPFRSVCLSRFNKRNLSNSNARKCLSQPRQAVCLLLLGSQLSLHLSLVSSPSIVFVCFVTVYST